MRLSVKVKPNAKKDKAEKLGENQLTLWVKSPAQEGRANQAAIELMSKYFGIAKNRVTIIRGQRSKNKIIEVI